MTLGRPPEGPELADRLEGTPEAKKRMKTILETLTGERTIQDACELLGIAPARFHEIRKEALQAACAAIEAKPAGRPPSPEPVVDPRVKDLEDEVKQLKLELRASNVREQIALVMPHVLKPESDEKPAQKKRKRWR